MILTSPEHFVAKDREEKLGLSAQRAEVAKMPKNTTK
jgi:hypothetical protein